MALLKLSGTGESMTSAKTKINDAFDKVDSLDTSVAGINTNVETLNTDVGKLKTDSGTLKTDVTTLKSDVANLKTAPSGGHVVSATAPTNKALIWFDSANGNIMKFWNGSAWVIAPAVWG